MILSVAKLSFKGKVTHFVLIFISTLVFLGYIQFHFYNVICTQVYDDSTEGQKVCTYYKLESIPAVLVIDPITGQKMHSWFGMVQPERLLEVDVSGDFNCFYLNNGSGLSEDGVILCPAGSIALHGWRSEGSSCDLIS